MQQDSSHPIEIIGTFSNVRTYTHLVGASNHRQSIESALDENNDKLTVARRLSTGNEGSQFGIMQSDEDLHNPGGLQSNLLKILPEVISIPATADTIDELKNTQNTALSKLKREVLKVFFEELEERTQRTLTDLDLFLHSEEEGQRSERLTEFEDYLREELTGEFSDVVPNVEFDLPDQEVIARGMRIILNDGHPSEAEQKGHGLQRATLLALLKVLAKHGERYQNRPEPLFLIGELESFLHPHAQMQFGDVLLDLVEQYQVITTTHSPFIISEKSIEGYRRVVKDSSRGTVSKAANFEEIDVEKVRKNLSLRGNLEALFADKIILVEGVNDQRCYEHLLSVLNIEKSYSELIMFTYVEGKGALHSTYEFYQQLGMESVSIIADLDYIFSRDIIPLLKRMGIDDGIPENLRDSLNISSNTPKLQELLDAIDSLGEPNELEGYIKELQQQKIFILRSGAPEHYFANGDSKEGWKFIESSSDLTDPDYLYQLLTEVVS